MGWHLTYLEVRNNEYGYFTWNYRLIFLLNSISSKKKISVTFKNGHWNSFGIKIQVQISICDLLVYERKTITVEHLDQQYITIIIQ